MIDCSPDLVPEIGDGLILVQEPGHVATEGRLGLFAREDRAGISRVQPDLGRGYPARRLGLSDRPCTADDNRAGTAKSGIDFGVHDAGTVGAHVAMRGHG